MAAMAGSGPSSSVSPMQVQDPTRLGHPLLPFQPFGGSWIISATAELNDTEGMFISPAAAVTAISHAGPKAKLFKDTVFY